MPDRTQKVIANNWTTIGQDESINHVDACDISDEEQTDRKFNYDFKSTCTPVAAKKRQSNTQILDLNAVMKINKTEKKKKP